MIAINLSGVTFTKPDINLESGEDVNVRHVEKYDDDEQAFGVYRGGELIGWIPKVGTINGYMKEAKKNMNDKSYLYHRERKAIAKFLRDMIHVDMFRNHLPVNGKVVRVQTDESQERVVSVSVQFDYM